MPQLVTPFADLDLIRQPEQQNEPLQAFDAADEYLLSHLHEQGIGPEHRVLLLNDGFGALACSLATHCQVTAVAIRTWAIWRCRKTWRAMAWRPRQCASCRPAKRRKGHSTGC